MKHFVSDDTGAVAIIAAICLLAVIGVSALAVDVGYWFTSKQQLQTAADSAALAGCNRLIMDASNDEVWETVEDYAGRNFTTPLGSTACTVVAPTPGGLSDITNEYVKVTVESVSPSFLARALGAIGGDLDTALIRAQSVARVGYLAGATCPTPWGLNVIDVGEMNASMSGSSTSMWDQGGGVWACAFPAGSSGPLTVRATNSLGYEETFNDLVSVGVLSPTGDIRSVTVSQTTFTSGVDRDCRVEVSLATTLAAGDKVTASIGGASLDLAFDAAAGTYVGVVPVPTTSDPLLRVPIEISVKKAKTTESVSAALLVRRANYIIRDVNVDPLFALPTQPVGVEVRTLDFEYGVQYQLKVEGGSGTTGNFQALDFASLDHSVCQHAEYGTGGHSGGSDYGDWIAGTSSVIVHLKDYVTSLPGDMVGPTKAGIDERLAGTPLITLEQWEALDRPATKQLFVIPICEKTEDPTGRSVVQIVSFGSFFMQAAPSGSKDPVVGVFVEYTEPGLIVVNNPPGGLAIEAAHLDAEHLDF